MGAKLYKCREFPQLTIAGVCQFNNHEYRTSNLLVQSRIEQSQSFAAGIVRIAEEDAEAPAQIATIKPGDLPSMKKIELQEVARQMKIEYGSDATRADLLSLIAAEMRREE